ncbi:hypothetical protein CTheo_8346 [Ceratobasidium theobromae]|uniref:Cyclin N-terminal domain-containing protein n=1 Tax=Ceratobasidium theobromae TaxID=1582974 RepID=A0A5N5Q8X7_9AGAM|nr:hypothetical protein CTheo_8346 [Ceratobasidium theobromae]
MMPTRIPSLHVLRAHVTLGLNVLYLKIESWFTLAQHSELVQAVIMTCLKMRLMPYRRIARPFIQDLAPIEPIDTSALANQYYGHEDTAKICAQYINQSFSCSDILPTTSHSTMAPTLAHFVAHTLYRTCLSPSLAFYALYLLSRLKDHFPTVTCPNGHRLYISAFMIAAKANSDNSYSNKDWCIVGQNVFSLGDINRMEREMCGFLRWILNVKPEDLRDFEAMVRKDYGSALAPPAPASVIAPKDLDFTHVERDQLFTFAHKDISCTNQSQPFAFIPEGISTSCVERSQPFAFAPEGISTSCVERSQPFAFAPEGISTSCVERSQPFAFAPEGISISCVERS